MQSSFLKRAREMQRIQCHFQQGEETLVACDGYILEHQDDINAALTFVASLKACAKQKDLQEGSRIHTDIIRCGLLEKNIFVGNTLISMYAKCGAIEKAQEVFDELPLQNVVSWNALMGGFVQNGHGQQALNCFEQMQLRGFTPDAFTFVCSLKACGSIRALEKGKEIHDRIERECFLGKDIVVVNALVDMYAKCGAFGKAQEVFDELPIRSVVSWTALITGYAQHGHFKKALNCFKQMQHGGFLPDAITLACILKACGSIGALDDGREIHALIVKEHSLGEDIVVDNALVDMYAKCGALGKAQEIFNELPSLNIISWNALITGYAQHAHGDEALSCFERMQRMGYSPDAITFMCILKACGSLGASDRGQEIHAQIVRARLLEKHVAVANALVDMYVKFGALEKAQEVFRDLPVRDIVSWNSLIAGYAQCGHGKEALSCFEQMKRAGFSPDEVTFACILRACGSIRALDKGQEVHAQLLKERLLEKHIVVTYALVDMYAKCGVVDKAQEVFDELPVRNLVVWTALIAGYADHGQGEEALSCFERMQLEGISPDAFAFACILKACSSVGAAYKGGEVHAKIVIHGLLEDDMVIGIALVVMYANFGMIAEAQDLFDKFPVRDVVTWSALMVGYAQLGKGEIVLSLFDKMTKEGMEPDTVSFTIVLNTCSRRGLVSKGQSYFEIISRGFGIVPTLRHHSCMVDLFGRAGHLDKAAAVIKKFPLSANFAMWHTLLGACQKWDQVKLGTWAFENAVQLHEKDPVVHVCVSNIQAAAGRQEV